MLAADGITIYHNPRCSKSCTALDLLRTAGLEVQVVDYLQTPPDIGELRRLLDLLGLPARRLLRTGETAYRELGLDDVTLSDEALIDTMARCPILIERPIVLVGNRAVIARPPEKLHEIL